MPELPEVETIVRGLHNNLVGFTINFVDLQRKDLRFPIPKTLNKSIIGKKITNIHRRGKYIVISNEANQTILMHLGMSGRIKIRQINSKKDKHDHVIMKLNNNNEIVFNDPRRFGMIDLINRNNFENHRCIKSLGPEPLGNAFNESYVADYLSSKKSSIKSVLLNQKFVAGLGNIYVCESLYLAGISPTRIANTIKDKNVKKLIFSIKKVLKQAINLGGCTIKDYVQASGEMGYFQQKLNVYGKNGKKCSVCDCKSSIKKITQNGRSTFFCSKKQR